MIYLRTTNKIIITVIEVSKLTQFIIHVRYDDSFFSRVKRVLVVPLSLCFSKTIWAGGFTPFKNVTQFSISGYYFSPFVITVYLTSQTMVFSTDPKYILVYRFDNMLREIDAVAF